MKFSGDTIELKLPDANEIKGWRIDTDRECSVCIIIVRLVDFQASSRWLGITTIILHPQITKDQVNLPIISPPPNFPEDYPPRIQLTLTPTVPAPPLPPESCSLSIKGLQDKKAEFVLSLSPFAITVSGITLAVLAMVLCDSVVAKFIAFEIRLQQLQKQMGVYQHFSSI